MTKRVEPTQLNSCQFQSSGSSRQTQFTALSLLVEHMTLLLPKKKHMHDSFLKYSYGTYAVYTYVRIYIILFLQIDKKKMQG